MRRMLSTHVVCPAMALLLWGCGGDHGAGGGAGSASAGEGGAGHAGLAAGMAGAGCAGASGAGAGGGNAGGGNAGGGNSGGGNAGGGNAGGGNAGGGNAGGGNAGGGNAGGGGGGGAGNGGGAAGTAGGAAGTGGGAAGSSGGQKRIVAYFAAWGVYGRNYHVADIPAGMITHINYAFANITADGQCALGDSYADIDRFYPGDSWDAGSLRGSFHQLQLLKQRQPNVKTLLSVGGWSWSGHFSDAALTDASRTRFAQSCVDLALRYGFDGVDIDWEYPGGGGLEGNVARPEDKQNFTLLLRALRNELDARGPGHLLSIAAPAGAPKIANLEVAAIHPLLDHINIMTYDYHGGWERATGFNAALYAATGDPTPDRTYNVDGSVKAFLQGGAPASKLVVGMPFYGRGWSGVTNANDGLFQAATGLPMGTWEMGVFDWHDIVQNYLPRMARHVSPDAKVPWLFDPATGVMISYDDPESLGLKADYVNANGLGGAMFWELSGDDAQHSLLTALHSKLR